MSEKQEPAVVVVVVGEEEEGALPQGVMLEIPLAEGALLSSPLRVRNEAPLVVPRVTVS